MKNALEINEDGMNLLRNGKVGLGEGVLPYIHAICRCAGWGFKQFLLNKTRLVHCD